jgi:FtsZ-binding cell division protein ZapB
LHVDGCVDPKSRGATAGFGAKFTELTFVETMPTGSPTLGSDANTDEVQKSNFGGQCCDVYLHKSGKEMLVQVLVGVDANMTAKVPGKIKYIEGRKATFSAPRNQIFKWHIKENTGVTRKALIPLPASDFDRRIRICRQDMYIDPMHPLADDPQFKAYCKDMDEELWHALEKDLEDIELFEYFRSSHGVCFPGQVIAHLRANKSEVDQGIKEARALDYMACDISRAVTWPFRKDLKRGVQQAIMDQANQDQLLKFKMAEKLGLIMLGYETPLPCKALLDFGMPKVSFQGRPAKGTKETKSQKPETRGRKSGSTKGKRAVTDLTTTRRGSARVANTTKAAKEMFKAGKPMPGAQQLVVDKEAPDGVPNKPNKSAAMTKSNLMSLSGYNSEVSDMSSNISNLSNAMTTVETKLDALPKLLSDEVGLLLNKSVMELVDKVARLETENGELKSQRAEWKASSAQLQHQCDKWEAQLQSSNNALFAALQAHAAGK